MKSPSLDARNVTRPFLTRLAPPVRRAPIAFACCAILLTACHSHEAPAPELQPVVALAVHADNDAGQRVLPAQVQARYSTPLSFRVGGKIVERRVRIGDVVKAGQALAMLDPADLRNTLLNARAQLDAAEYRAVYAKHQLERDRAQAQANLIAPAQLETTQDAYASAVAQRDSALAQMALADDHLRYATLIADHDGVITSEDANTGQNVESGQAVFHLDWSGDLDIVCDVSERDLRDLAVGRVAHVGLTALPGKILDARVREIAAAADPQSRTWRVKLTLIAPGPDVRSGMTANVTFDGTADAAAGHAITLPATALFHRGETPAVWVVRKGSDTLELRPVSIGRYDERTVSITSGLESGERVVMQGVHTVSAGERVRPVPPLHPEEFPS
ncbi:RND transporter MFP subunit [Burkholderia lata]|uniref:efflux RND transporter periplasmic adaptor subunit n=1 Tax=Burkholderia lata (strain ATCC 17760 / DSM 23089 / LMG 22485 / NCIMB 9086 / R18194 / 383) TaxID=482957 RepID=UPI0008414C38|nr:RND transporter MFP subunit [Burkholderia lata]